VDMRLTTSSQSIQSVVTTPNKKTPTAATTTTAAPLTTAAASTVYKTRCRDFDGKFNTFTAAEQRVKDELKAGQLF